MVFVSETLTLVKCSPGRLHLERDNNFDSIKQGVLVDLDPHPPPLWDPVSLWPCFFTWEQNTFEVARFGVTKRDESEFVDILTCGCSYNGDLVLVGYMLLGTTKIFGGFGWGIAKLVLTTLCVDSPFVFSCTCCFSNQLRCPRSVQSCSTGFVCNAISLAHFSCSFPFFHLILVSQLQKARLAKPIQSKHVIRQNSLWSIYKLNSRANSRNYDTKKKGQTTKAKHPRFHDLHNARLSRVLPSHTRGFVADVSMTYIELNIDNTCIKMHTPTRCAGNALEANAPTPFPLFEKCGRRVDPSKTWLGARRGLVQAQFCYIFGESQIKVALVLNQKREF